MIDKVDVRIPWRTPFSREVRDVITQLWSGPVFPFQPSRFYTYVGDLRKSHDIDAILHLEYKFNKDHKPTSKLEVLDAGKKTIDEIAETISRVVDVDVFPLGLMRVDLAGDIVGVPVHVFREFARFLYKRFASRIEKSIETELMFVAMGTAEAQSLYAGRRPDFIRIYNKIKEWFAQWLKLKRNCERFNKGMARFPISPEQRHFGARFYPTFEKFCRDEGYIYEEGATLTRIERQISGGRLPKELQVFGDLRKATCITPSPLSGWCQPAASAPLLHLLRASRSGIRLLRTALAP